MGLALARNVTVGDLSFLMLMSIDTAIKLYKTQQNVNAISRMVEKGISKFWVFLYSGGGGGRKLAENPEKATPPFVGF